MNAKSSAQALREHKTNEETVQDIMNFSRYGALSQAFVMWALGQYSKKVMEAPEASLHTDFMPAGVWKGIAAEVAGKLRAGGYLEDEDSERVERVEPEGVASVVVLHTPEGDVRTSYPAHRQADAIALWQDYAASGKKASLIVD